MSHAAVLMEILMKTDIERARRREARRGSPVGRLVTAEDAAEATIARSAEILARSRELVKATAR